MSVDVPLVLCECGESYCCGDIGHPIGKPWGWNWEAWDEHWPECSEDVR